MEEYKYYIKHFEDAVVPYSIFVEVISKGPNPKRMFADTTSGHMCVKQTMTKIEAVDYINEMINVDAHYGITSTFDSGVDPYDKAMGIL